MKRIVLFMVCIFLLPAIFTEASTNEKNVQLFFATERGMLADVQDALNGGADVNAKNAFGVTALMMASYGGYTLGRYAEVVKLLLDKGADVNVRNNKGETALMEASHYGNAEVVKLLLAKGADINVKNSIGKTALDVAKYTNRTEIVGILERAGAKK
jgi:ankyrin repeat protein